MFKRQEIRLTSNPACNNPVEDLTSDDFRYYDKDGFELNIAERKFYSANNLPLIDCLNHICWQQPWFLLEHNNSGLILDHCMFLCRANYEGAARQQLEKLSQEIPLARYLLNTRVKWGYDFALDAVRGNEPFEVLHVEYDNLDYERFTNNFISFDYLIRHTDWNDAADRIWQQRDQWQHLVGFEQNNWKAKYLVGWNKAEHTEKSVKEL
jgi:hypothetical protein